jgi:CDP-glucose 4,6-dehydratase
MPSPAFWQGRRVFLTGHTGFKGSWLSLWLQSLGAQVTGFALPPPTDPNLFEEAGVDQGMTSCIADVRDFNHLHSALRDAAPEVVIHMAAQPLVRQSYRDPVETYSTNVMGTVNLLESIRKTPDVRAVVVVTTDKCYENREWIWSYRENEPMGGHDPYSSSKGCAELVIAAFRASFFSPETFAEHGVAIASARAGNVIGGGDWASDRLIPDLIAGLEQGKPVSIRNPGAIRPWQHVLEPLRGYLMLAQSLFEKGPAFAEPWNFGPNDVDSRPVKWIASTLSSMFENASGWVADSAKHPHEATYLKLDISKARTMLGWNPLLSLEEALQLIVNWEHQKRKGMDMRAVTLAQIRDYATREQ